MDNIIVTHFLKHDMSWFIVTKQPDLRNYKSIKLLYTSIDGDVFIGEVDEIPNPETSRIFRGMWNKGIV